MNKYFMVKPTMAKLEMIKLTNGWIFYGSTRIGWTNHDQNKYEWNNYG